MDHDELLAAVERYFQPGTTAWEKHPEILLPKMPKVDRSVAQYTGGEVRVRRELCS